MAFLLSLSLVFISSLMELEIQGTRLVLINYMVNEGGG